MHFFGAPDQSRPKSTAQLESALDAVLPELMCIVLALLIVEDPSLLAQLGSAPDAASLSTFTFVIELHYSPLTILTVPRPKSEVGKEGRSTRKRGRYSNISCWTPRD